MIPSRPTKLLSVSRLRAMTKADLHNLLEPLIVHKGDEQFAVLLPYRQYMKLQEAIIKLRSIIAGGRE